MSEYFVIRLAGPTDLDVIMDLLAEATRWLRSKDTDQWQGRADRRPQVEKDIARDLVWVVECRSQDIWPSRPAAIIASITIDERADPAFWSTEEQTGKALYCHRMVVAREFAGRGIGAALLDWAAWRARRKLFESVRLDAWLTNAALHQYYKAIGFEMVRSQEVPGRGSGALFERPASDPPHDDSPVLVRVGHRRSRTNREARPSSALLLLRFAMLLGPVCVAVLMGRPGLGPYACGRNVAPTWDRGDGRQPPAAAVGSVPPPGLLQPALG